MLQNYVRTNRWSLLPAQLGLTKAGLVLLLPSQRGIPEHSGLTLCVGCSWESFLSSFGTSIQLFDSHGCSTSCTAV